MIFCLSDARTYCQDVIRQGVDPDSSEALDVINEATNLLLRKGHWAHSLKRIFIRTYNNVFPCPASIEAIRKVNFCNRPGFVFNQWYEFMDSGPGTIFNHEYNTVGLDLMDQGIFPTFFPIGTTALNIIAMSTEAGDIDKEIRIRGFNSSREEINPTTPGEVIKINRWAGGVEGTMENPLSYDRTSNEFLEISSIVKPTTAGYVTLYGVNFDSVQATPTIHFLGKYGPNETQPGYRRYKITSTTESDENCILALAKIRYVPLVHDSDPLLIQDLPSLKLMCKAIHEMNHGEMADYRVLRDEAVELLDEQLKDGQAPQIMLDMDEEMSFGSLPDVG